MSNFQEEKLKQELCKLKPITPKRKGKGIGGAISYNDVVWFLLKYYKTQEGIK